MAVSPISARGLLFAAIVLLQFTMIACYGSNINMLTMQTCRLPVKDSYRTYYLANTGREGAFACLKYGDVAIGGEPVYLAIGCETNGAGVSQLVLKPGKNENCKKAISEPSRKPACNVLSRELETNGLTLRSTLRLTGQPTGGTVQDKLYVTADSYVCTESFGDSRNPVPLAVATKCAGGMLSRQRQPGFEVTVNTHNCSVINFILDYSSWQ